MTAQPEITTAADRAQAPGTAETEPLMTLTQLQSLLREAAALERAQRPIIIRPSAEAFAEQPVTWPTAPAHTPPPRPGACLVTAPAFQAPPAPLRRLDPAGRAWGVRLAYASILLSLAGAADGMAAGTGIISVGACALGIVGAVTGTARALSEQDRAQEPRS